jgi:prepilin-type N-terminal cleavage/methylation domain-containing protein
MKRKQNKYGLTLLEVLVAITIIAILAAGLYTLSSSIERQAKERLTKSTIEILCTALEQYHNLYGSFPVLTAVNVYPTTGCDGVERLYYSLTLAPDAKAILSRINSAMIVNNDTDEDPNIYPEIVDAWGTDIMYRYTVGTNFPVIISNGPDKKQGNDDDISSRQ